MTHGKCLASQQMRVEAQAKEISVRSQEPHPGQGFWDLSVSLGLLMCVALLLGEWLDWGSVSQRAWTSGTARGCVWRRYFCQPDIYSQNKISTGQLEWICCIFNWNAKAAIKDLSELSQILNFHELFVVPFVLAWCMFLHAWALGEFPAKGMKYVHPNSLLH